MLQQAAEKGWTGGLVYDALHLAAARSSYSAGGWRATIAFTAYFEFGWARLAQALHRKPQGAIFDFGFQHAAHGISLR